MRTVLGTAIAFLLVFFVLAWIGIESGTGQPAPLAMEFALQWTMRLFGTVTAVVAAVGLLFVAASKGGLERQLDLVLPLLGGLLLINPNWGVALALGVFATAWLVRECCGSRGRTSS